MLKTSSSGDGSLMGVISSLNRNMFVSLFCSVKRVLSDMKKWRLAGADRDFTFLHYNLTTAYHRTNLSDKTKLLLSLTCQWG